MSRTTSKTHQEEGQGRRFAPFFTAACIWTRQQAGEDETAVLPYVGLKTTNSIVRFERGETFPTGNFEAYAAGYAAVGKIDPRDLVALAVDWWRKHGARPLTAKERQRGVEDGYEPSAAEIIAAIRRAEEERGEAEEPPTSNEKKKAAGE